MIPIAQRETRTRPIRDGLSYSTNGYHDAGISDREMKLATRSRWDGGRIHKGQKVQVLSESYVDGLRLHSALLNQRPAYGQREHQKGTQFGGEKIVVLNPLHWSRKRKKW